MQSGGGTQQGLGGAVAGHGRNAASASASPASSSSAVSTPRLGFEQQQQQQQQYNQRQQQLLRKSDGSEAILAFQASGLHGVLAGGNFVSCSGSMQLPQQSRKLIDLAQQQGSPHVHDEVPNRSQAFEQQVLNPVHQAYLQYAFQAAQQKSAGGIQLPHQTNLGVVGYMGKDQDPRMANLIRQEMISILAANQAQASSSKKSSEHFVRNEMHNECGKHLVPDQKSDSMPASQPTSVGQIMPGNVTRPLQAAQQNLPNSPNNQLAVAAQMQALQAFAVERNMDLSFPANANSMTQLYPFMQSRMAAQPKPNEGNISSPSSSIPVTKQKMTSPQAVHVSSPRGNTSTDGSGQSISNKAGQMIQPGPLSSSPNAAIVNNLNNMPMQHFSGHGRENQLPPRQPVTVANGMPSVHPPQTMNLNQVSEKVMLAKNKLPGPETLQMQYARQLNCSSPQSAASSRDGNLGHPSTFHGGQLTQMQQKRIGFTKQQLHVLRAQILAFRRLKKGDGALPRELLQAIGPPPLETQIQPMAGMLNQERSSGKVDGNPKQLESSEKDALAVPSTCRQNISKEEPLAAEEKVIASTTNLQGTTAVTKEHASVVNSGKVEHQATTFITKSEQEAEHGIQRTPAKPDFTADRGKSVVPQIAASETVQVKKPVQASNTSQAKDVGSARKYHGPLFDFPSFTRKHDTFGSAMMLNNNNLTLAYDIKDLIVEEAVEVLNRKREDKKRKIGDLLARNLDRKRIRPDLVLKLQIEQKKLGLMDLQARVRDEVDQQQQEIMAMPDRPYRKFVRLCERQRLELTRQVHVSQKATREKQLKSVFQWRKKFLESHWGTRDARTARNRGVAKYHERMLREFSKRKDDDRNKRMEALKNNDVERYREMLLEQQTSISGDAAERYAVLSSFLTQTEDYLHKLGSKITAAKNQQEVEEAANTAAAAARSQDLSEEEVRAAAACAREEVMIRNRFSEMNTPKTSSSVNKYYTLAHAVNERVIKQPSMLRVGTLRDYQLVGLQWMLSLYNNKLNGILADEMGLGKTVQVMALIAYLMEFKGNYGPHLIIVPNAVLVNWKSELHNWLPSVSCIFYVGSKDQRSKLFSQEVSAMKFNVLVTTYEFIMYDRTKLSKVDWKYIIIDEAQRMKDRESVLARDLDRYRCQRRLLLTGTPLQNDLKELWSLLNLLLPEVFDNRKAFHDWFSKPFQKEGPAHNTEDDWLETEKKVIIIHRLHQILEPFMLRRRVEDVEGSLPRKDSIVLRCRMSAIQSAVYDWIKSTGTLRVDPEDEKRRVLKNPNYQAKTYKPLNNRCMELRKACNHPLLNYPYFNDFSKDFLVKSCGKLWILDRILLKLHRTGHRVLLFSTMTKLLDIMEEYLQWRRLVYRRIDGTTSLEDRESAIVDFNHPDTDCFIFLLSIRAAGRGLNLQSADTVIIYDPDPNPKNEEQAVARAHRIGQTREVKVIYMEAVVDKISSHQKEDEFRGGGMVDSEDDLAGKDWYMGSIESLIRNNIQQYKIDMADEVINAGRFDQRTTHEERRLTLETLLHDEERYQETVHDVPSLQEVNRMIARSDEEVEIFDQMDDELDWTEEMTRYDQVPTWLRACTREMNATVANLSKKPSKNILFGGNIGIESGEMATETDRKRGRPKGKKVPIYAELDDESGEFSEASSEERDGYSVPEEEGEIGEFEDDEEDSGTVRPPAGNQNQSEEDAPVSIEVYEYAQAEGTRDNQIAEEAGSSGSSSDSQRQTKIISPSISLQKFGSLSELDTRPSSLSKRLADELEEGEIAVSGDSHMDLQQSGSWIHDREEGEDEQVLQPKIKRKRSIRIRPRHTAERPGERPSEKSSLPRGDTSQLSFLLDHKYETQFTTDCEQKIVGELSSFKHEQSDSSLKSKGNSKARKISSTVKAQASVKPGRMTCKPSPSEGAGEHYRESWDGKVMNAIGASIGGAKMSDIIQRRCKNVISKLQRRIDKEGHQIVPLLTDLWKHSGYMSGVNNGLLDLRKIDQRVDRFEYSEVMELVSDVQLMLKSAAQYFGFSHEVRSEARKVHDLFFDILKIAFPDTDFREARNAVIFSATCTASTSASSSRLPLAGQTKRHKLVNEAEPKLSASQKPLSRGSVPTGEDARARGHVSHQKESRLGSGSSSSRELRQQDEARPFTHPGELVICKKKRKDREKSVLKPGSGSAGPASPSGVGRNMIVGSGPIAKDTSRLSQQSSTQQQGWTNQPPQQQVSGVVGWANPVKRMRTDAGKRRPSHL